LLESRGLVLYNSGFAFGQSVRLWRGFAVKIALGCDHAGWQMKEFLKKILEEKGHTWEDFGWPDESACSEQAFIARDVSNAVLSARADRGILSCGTGQLMAMSANKIPGIRCALCNELFTARFARSHNDSNVLAMGGRIVGPELAKEIVHVWLTTPFEGGRHSVRLGKMREIEEQCSASARTDKNRS